MKRKNPIKGVSVSAANRALGVGSSLIATEHFYSTLLTSPMTAKRFFGGDPEGEAEVRDALKKAVWLSLGTGGVLSLMLKEPWPLIASAVLSAFYWNVYEEALSV